MEVAQPQNRSSRPTSECLFEGFEQRRIACNEVEINLVVGGSGPPLLLLHGDPQTHVCWHQLAPELADHYTLVIPDLRGRGDSGKPGASHRHVNYSKRIMARDQIALMSVLGFKKFSLAGHDRGARVAQRLALDHPEKLERLALIDIVPVWDFYWRINRQIAQEYYYFSFLTQPYDVPETLIGGNPDYYAKEILFGVSKSKSVFNKFALSEYLRCFRDPATIHAICECFRAGATIDLEHDDEDRRRGAMIESPTLVLYGRESVVGRLFDVEDIWSTWCKELECQAVPGGHFVPEEAPLQTAQLLLEFLGS